MISPAFLAQSKERPCPPCALLGRASPDHGPPPPPPPPPPKKKHPVGTRKPDEVADPGSRSPWRSPPASWSDGLDSGGPLPRAPGRLSLWSWVHRWCPSCTPTPGSAGTAIFLDIPAVVFLLLVVALHSEFQRGGAGPRWPAGAG